MPTTPWAMAATDTQADTTEQLCELCIINPGMTYIKNNTLCMNTHGQLLFSWLPKWGYQPLHQILKSRCHRDHKKAVDQESHQYPSSPNSNLFLYFTRLSLRWGAGRGRSVLCPFEKQSWVLPSVVDIILVWKKGCWDREWGWFWMHSKRGAITAIPQKSQSFFLKQLRLMWNI